MCGIFAYIAAPQSNLSSNEMRALTDRLFLLSESRGKEASGIVIVEKNIARIYKHPLKASELIQTPAYKNLFKQTRPDIIIGHTRLATNGQQSDNRNNQPVSYRGLIAVHNGIIVNDKQLWATLGHLRPTSQIDTQVFCAMVYSFLNKGYSHDVAIKNALKKIKGSASIIMLSSNSPDLFATTNTGSLFMVKTNEGTTFASEATTIKNIYPTSDPRQIPPGTIVQIPTSSPANFRIVDVLKTPKSSFLITPKTNAFSTLKKHIPPYDEIANIRRCTQCILPETMPFIKFNDDGVCNFCTNYKKIHYQGQKALKRKISGDARCIVALSGGRDSSYGLHYIKKVLGLKPIAYTYDWGMLTDLGRRNQARMVGALGVEHIIVSADIDKKRAYVRNNIVAWMKKPSLAMVPLFMAGDKQAEYFAEKLRQKTGIPLIFYCRGNELENEEFKFGLCGVQNGTPGGVTHHLSVSGKIRMALYYGRSYLGNPAYINGSLIDVLSAYYSMYLMPHQFVYLWHYIPWKEKTIIDTLTNTYGWETAHDTTATWRIDDGTVPFYNYIYYVVQGFTENDTFRSNQIREGIMTRNKALRLATQENQPRYEALAWYFNTLNLSGHDVLTIVDNMPKRYRNRVRTY